MRGLKRLICTVVSLCLILSVCRAAAVSIDINGTELELAAQPYMKNNRVMVPLRGVFENLGAVVEWDETSMSITVTRDDKSAYFVIGSNTVYAGGREVYIDVAPELVGGRTFVPVRAVSESLGCRVNWTEDKGKVCISTEETRYYYTDSSVPDFGACFGVKPEMVVDGYIYSYNLDGLSIGPGERYAEILKSEGFAAADGGTYSVYSKGDAVVLAGCIDGTFRVVITK